ncbi:Trs120 protein [Saccharomycopsis crataegensis]|uniref:Trs120 protein n=1 Tax=Saccharomycopsis crataegensis TaxID=43959 RepID=A0AAV5QM25_9ASCO|nr:Trs120 protein [Saccharomycopsis crataegensis]
MVMDPYSYTSPARVKSLFLPLADMPNDQFLACFENFKDKHQVRLVDVTPRSEANTVNKFSPQGFPLGSVLYDHQLAQIDNQEIFLQDFEPFRKIFVVVGFIKYSDGLTLSKLNLHLKNLKKVFKYSIVHNIVVFDSENKDLINPEANNIFHIQKSSNNNASEYPIMCDITSNFLNALNSYAQSFQHVTLRSPGSINSNDVLKITITDHTSAYENTEISTTDAVKKSSGSKGTEKIKDTKNKGRHIKILGNFYLLAGRYSDALREFGDAILLLKSSSDYLWLASCLEYIGICLTLLTHLNVPYQLPQSLLKFINSKEKNSSSKNTPDASPRNSLSRSSTMNNISGQANSQTNTGSSSNLGGSKLVSIDKLNLQIPEIIDQLTNKLLFYYSLTFTNHEDYVPQIVYCETIIRFLKFMTIIHVGNGFNSYVIDHIVMGTPIPEKKINEFFFSKMDIFTFSNKLFKVQLKNMSLNSQCKIYCSLASVYDDLELYRKKTFILRTLFLKLIPELTKSQAVSESRNTEDQDEDDELISRSAEIFEKNQQLQTQVELNTKLLNDVDSGSSAGRNNNESLHKLLNNLLLIYGIGSSPKNSTNNFKRAPWFQIHKSVLNLCIDICKSIIDFRGIVFFSSILLSKYINALTKQEQISLFSLIGETQQKAKNVNQVIPCYYWDPFLVRDITLLNEFDETLMPIKLKELPAGSNTTIETDKKPLGKESSSVTNVDKVMSSAVIYNPFEENKRNRAKLQRKSSKRLSSSGLGLKPKSRRASKVIDVDADTSIASLTGSIKEENEEGGDYEEDGTATTSNDGDNVDSDEEEEYEDVVEDNFDDEGIVLVQDEIFTVLVKVQNPFEFDIELSEIAIKANEELELETLVNNNQNQFTINADSVTTLRIAVRPLNYGELKIIGAEMKVNNCERQLFKIIHKEKYEVLEKIKKVGIEANLPSNKSKLSPLSNNTGVNGDESSAKIANRVEFKNLNLVVITPQPILSLIDLSLNNGWIMLLEGEKSSFKIVLKNLSNIKINYLAFSFLDSTIEPLTKALQSKDLPINEIYEIEYYLLKRKPLKIQKSEINKLKFIKPLDYLNLNFDIRGKRGMRDAHIILDYGNQHSVDPNNKDVSEDEKSAQQFSNFFRRISIPISVTVSPSIELAGCDLIPLFNNVKELNEDKINVIQSESSKAVQNMKEFALEQKNIWAYLNKKTNNKVSDYCLLVVDLRNSWNQKFKVTLKSSDFVLDEADDKGMGASNDDDDDDFYSISETIAPGHTERFILPIKRIEFSNEYLERSIPSLRNKQFIVQDNKYTKEEFKYIREAFWYRKELLRHIKGDWVEEGSKRQGDIELRGIRLSQRMVSVLRIEKIGIEMQILNDHQNIKNNGLYWEVSTEQFATIRTKIINRSNYVLQGFIRHVPISNNHGPIDRKILYNGVLQLNIGQEGILPGESKDFDLGVVILDKGEYEWGAIFDEQIFDSNNSVDLQHTQREPLFIRAV